MSVHKPAGTEGLLVLNWTEKRLPEIALFDAASLGIFTLTLNFCSERSALYPSGFLAER